MSVVIKNRMVDVVRAFKPEYNIEEAHNIELEMQSGEDDYVNVIVDGLHGWFIERFSSMVKPYLATEVLECIIRDLISISAGKRKSISYLVNDYGYSREHAKILYESCVIKLRSNIESHGVRLAHEVPENSLHPEFLEIVGADVYRIISIAFSGLSLTFDKLEDN